MLDRAWFGEPQHATLHIFAVSVDARDFVLTSETTMVGVVSYVSVAFEANVLSVFRN